MTKNGTYLGLVEHAQVDEHVHGIRLGAGLAIQPGGIHESLLVGINVGQKHITVHLPSLLPSLVAEKSETQNTAKKKRGGGGEATSVPRCRL